MPATRIGRLFRLIASSAALVLGCRVSAQNPVLDSLEKTLAASSDTHRVKNLCLLCWEYRFFDPQKAVRYGEEGKNLADEIGFDRYRVRCRNMLGLAYASAGDYVAAIALYTEAVPLAEADGAKRKNLAALLNNLAEAYRETGDYAQALEAFFRALKILEELKDEREAATVKEALGLLYLEKREFPQARKYMEAALAAYEKTDYDDGLVSCLQNMGNLYRQEGFAQNDKRLLEQALAFHRRSLAAMDTVHDLSRLATAYANIGDVYTLLGAYKEAERYFLRAEALSQKVGDMATLGFIYGRHADLAAKTGQTAAARRYNELALKLMLGSGAKNGVWAYAEKLAALDSSAGNWQAAYRHLRTAFTYKDSVFDEEKARALGRLESRRQLDEKEQRIALQNAEIKRKTQVQYLAVAAAVFLLIAAVAALTAYRQKRRDAAKLETRGKEIERQNAELEAQAHELAARADAIAAANERLKELSTFKEALTGAIVHDLKNPLGVILGAADRNPEHPDFAVTRRAAKQMLTLTLNLLDVQKFESAQMALHIIRFPLLDVVRSAHDHTRHLTEAKNIEVVFDIAPDLYLNADFDLVERVFINLLVNAAKYTPNNGTITLTGQFSESAAEIWVKDTGAGIPQDFLPRIFEKFAQASPQNAGGVRSSGLGLTFCKMAVEAHGGNIAAESAPARGAAFRLILPGAEKGAPVAPTGPKPNADLTLSDDEKDVVRRFKSKMEGVSVFEVSRILGVLDEIQAAPGTALDEWKKKTTQAVFACNDDLFHMLLKGDAHTPAQLGTAL